MGIQAHWLIYKLGCIPSSLRVVYVFLLVYSHLHLGAEVSGKCHSPTPWFIHFEKNKNLVHSFLNLLFFLDKPPC